MTKSGQIVSNSAVRVAIVGYGLAGSTFHAPFVSTIPGYQLVAVVARDLNKRLQVAADLPGTEILDSVDEIWRRSKDFDLVVIASPNQLHFAMAKAAMEAGLAVVVDKPIAASASECHQLIDISERTGSLLTVFQNRRWDSDFVTAKRLINSGALGDVYRFESRFERWRPVIQAGKWQEQTSVEDGGGRLFDFGSHLIDQVVHLFGEPLRLYAEVNTRRPGAVADDDTFVAIEFAGGVQAHLWMSFLAKKLGPRFHVRGSKGCFEKFDLDPQEDWLRAGRRPQSGIWNVRRGLEWGEATLVSDVAGLEHSGRIEIQPSSYGEFYIQLRDAIKYGDKPPVDPREVLTTMRIIESARESSAHNCVVDLRNQIQLFANPYCQPQ